jgi:hypothetical protein
VPHFFHGPFFIARSNILLFLYSKKCSPKLPRGEGSWGVTSSRELVISKDIVFQALKEI